MHPLFCTAAKTTIINTMISETKAEFNRNLKRFKLLQTNTYPRESMEVRYMHYLINALEPGLSATKHTITTTPERDEHDGYDFPLPTNGAHYTIGEALTNHAICNMTISQFHIATTSMTPPIIICSRETLFRYYKMKPMMGSLPTEGDYGITVGRPRIIPDSQLKKTKGIFRYGGVS